MNYKKQKNDFVKYKAIRVIKITDKEAKVTAIDLPFSHRIISLRVNDAYSLYYVLPY
jgi:hypothetical protein